MEGMHNQKMGSARKDLTPPCKGCPERHTACHDSCGKYAEYKGRLEDLKAYEEKNKNMYVYDPLAPKFKRDI